MAAPSSAIRLSDAIEEHLASCRSSGGNQRSTLRNKRVTLDKLLNQAGNILMKNVGAGHVDGVFAEMQNAGLRAGSMNLHRTNLATFFAWCSSRRYATGASPMVGVRRFKEIPRDRIWVPSSKFAHLLDCATHPRNRMIVALGLYLFLRQSEIKKLTVQDVNLEDGFVSVIIYKTKQRDEMPISRQLDKELRRYLTWYAGAIDGPIEKSFYLLPARSPARFTGTREGLKRIVEPERLSPRVYLKRLERIAKEALVGAGYELRDGEGASLQEGMHTLRRSGARARYDFLVDVKGYDGALRQVQAMLHHASTKQTEEYLGLTLDVKARNESIRGQDMFGEDSSSTVVHLSDRQVN